MQEAIAILEVQSFTTAVAALDAMLKTADVEFLRSEKTLGGELVTLIVQGKVDSVTVALESGILAAERIGKVVAHRVIPRPHPEIMKFIVKQEEKVVQAPSKRTGRKNGKAEQAVQQMEQGAQVEKAAQTETADNLEA